MTHPHDARTEVEANARVDGVPRDHEERYPVHATHGLHVFSRFDEDQSFEVWLNTEAGDYDGLILGIGATRQEAVTEAVITLERALAILQGPPPVER